MHVPKAATRPQSRPDVLPSHVSRGFPFGISARQPGSQVVRSWPEAREDDEGRITTQDVRRLDFYSVNEGNQIPFQATGIPISEPPRESPHESLCTNRVTLRRLFSIG